MSGWPVLVEQSQACGAPAAHVWPLLTGPAALALRPSSFAFDVEAPAAQLRVVLSVPATRPIFVVYQAREDLAGRVVSLTLPGKPSDGAETLTLSAIPERAGSRVTIQVSSVVADRSAQAVVTDYWQRAMPAWLAGLCDVAEGRAPLPDGRMPARLHAACVPAALPGRPASATASAAIAAPAGAVWEAVCAPESAALMSRSAAAVAGAVPGTPARQPGELWYLITRLDDGQLRMTVTVVGEISAGRLMLSSVAGAPLEVLHRIEPDGQRTRLELTFRWPAGIPNRHAVARSMTDAARNRVRAFKDLIENPDPPRIA